MHFCADEALQLMMALPVVSAVYFWFKGKFRNCHAFVLGALRRWAWRKGD